MNSEAIAAAILAAGFAAGERQALHSGHLDENIREKFTEYYAFVCAHTARAKSEKKKKKKKPRAR